MGPKNQPNGLENMKHNTLKLRRIDEEKKTSQRYHISAVNSDGKIIFDSAFSDSENIENQILTALNEWIEEDP